MYKLIKNIEGEVCVVAKLADNLFIPFDPANTDYQQYLRWCEEGNTPTPADKGTQ